MDFSEIIIFEFTSVFDFFMPIGNLFNVCTYDVMISAVTLKVLSSSKTKMRFDFESKLQKLNLIFVRMHFTTCHLSSAL